MSTTTNLSAGWAASFAVERCTGADRTQPGSALEVLMGVLRTAGPAPGPIALSGTHGRGLWRPMMRGHVYDFEVVLPPTVAASAAAAWLDRLRSVLKPEVSGFSALLASDFGAMEVESLDLGDNAEVALNFRTPLHLKGSAARQRVDAAWLIQAMTRRAEAWLGRPIALDVKLTTVNDALWHYDSLSGQSAHHAPGMARSIRGWRGPLVIRGDLRGLGDVLGLLQRIHLDDEALSGRGCFDVQDPAPAAYQRELTDPHAVALTADWVLSHTDADPVVDTDTGQAISAVEIGQRLANQLAHGSWHAKPAHGFRLPKADGGWRTVERLNTLDAIVHRHLHQLLSGAFDHGCSDAAFAFRHGRGRDAALDALRAARRDGFGHVLRADVESCYDHISPERALSALEPWLPRTDLAMRQAVREAVMCPAIPPQGGEPALRTGLAQGSALSPGLANMVLTLVDQQLDSEKVRLIRFADDMAVCCCSREDVDRAKVALEAALGQVGLGLNARKTSLHAPDEPVDFLGETVRAEADDDLDAALAQRKPLFVTEPYTSLHAHAEAVDVRRNGELLLTVPLRRISEIMLVQRATLSTTLISRCAAQGISITVALDSGRRTATFAPESRDWFEVSRLQGNRYEDMSDGARLAVATAIVAAKLANNLGWIRQLGRPEDDELVDRLARLRVQAASAGHLEELRGFEGMSARLGFGWLNARITPGCRENFNAEARMRGGPDRLNATLNFGYHLLATRLYTQVRAQGLNPHLGFLHNAQQEYGTLVWDCMEPFRVHVDRTVVRLINHHRLLAEHFEFDPRGHRLVPEGKRVLATGLEETWNSRSTGWLLRDLMLAQAKALRDWACGRGPLWWHQWRHGGSRQAPPPRAAAALDLDDGGPAG